jgi:hypothetical protein
MTWTMPRPTLMIVAGLLGIGALGSFTMGVLGAQERGRLPGERVAERQNLALKATDATPFLEMERLEGATTPKAPLTEAEKAKLEAAKLARAAQVAQLTPAPAPRPAEPARPANNPAPSAQDGPAKITPTQEEPPF